MSQSRVIVAAEGDTTCSNNAKITLQNIANENPDVNIFLGDSSYKDNA